MCLAYKLDAPIKATKCSTQNCNNSRVAAIYRTDSQRWLRHARR
jgi:hypothetical protein